jgi:hypothetical protein
MDQFRVLSWQRMNSRQKKQAVELFERLYPIELHKSTVPQDMSAQRTQCIMDGENVLSVLTYYFRTNWSDPHEKSSRHTLHLHFAATRDAASVRTFYRLTGRTPLQELTYRAFHSQARVTKVLPNNPTVPGRKITKRLRELGVLAKGNLSVIAAHKVPKPSQLGKIQNSRRK